MTQRDSVVLEALAQLEIKLTSLITGGLAQIKDDHARALLEQARLNATFASRDSTEQTRSQVDRHSSEILNLSARWQESAADRKDLREAIEQLTALISSRTISTYDRLTGWVIAGGLSAITLVVTIIFKLHSP